MNFNDIKIMYVSTPIKISGSIDTSDDSVKLSGATVKGLEIHDKERAIIERDIEVARQIKYILGINGDYGQYSKSEVCASKEDKSTGAVLYPH